MVDEQRQPFLSSDERCTASLLLQSQVFPESYPAWHPQILASLQQCAQTVACFDPTVTELLQPEVDWIATLSLSSGVPPSPMSPRQMREELKRKRILSKHFLVDAILSELVIGKVLNHELFAQLKGITVLACLALMFLKGEQATEEDSTLDDALRSVRLMANTERRQSVATTFSLINFAQPIEDLLESIAEQREQFINKRSVTKSSMAIETVLRRLYLARLKQTQNRSPLFKGRPKNRVVSSNLDGIDENTEFVLLRDISRRRGRVNLQAWEDEEDRSLTPQMQTLLVSTQGCGGLMDLQARRWQSQSVAAVMSMRNLLLPCHAGLATDEQVNRLVKALLDQFQHEENMAAGWNLLQLVMGMSDAEILEMPLWQTAKVLKPRRGYRRTEHDGNKRNRDGLWLTPTNVWLQRYVEVSQSRVHKKLSQLLPGVDLMLLLPLPEWAQALLRCPGSGAMERQKLLKSLAQANQEAGTGLTLRQLKNHLRIWLVRHGIDSAVAGVLRGKTAQQCSPIAYSHLPMAFVLAVWSDYLLALGMPVNSANSLSADDAVGSMLYPRHEELKALLGRYQAVVRPYCQNSSRDPSVLPILHNLRVRHCLLILHLSTAARPVTEMYGRRMDYCLLSRFIRLEDKEGRSVSSARLVPLGMQAIVQLQAWEEYLLDLASLSVPELEPLADSARKALDSSGPLFFWAEPAIDSGLTFTTEHVTPSNMMEQFEQLLPLAPNWHRHAVRSHLVEQQVPTHLIDALMGHEELGGEFSHQYSNAALSELFVLSDVLDQWHASLHLEAMTGWTIR